MVVRTEDEKQSKINFIYWKRKWKGNISV